MNDAQSFAERIESLKAGAIAGVMAGGLQLGVLAINVEGLSTGLSPLLEIAIAVLSGFLFGVTCRYVLRQDQNPHLGPGAVMAFGLVRGLTRLGDWTATQDWLHSGLWLIESLLLFAIAYLGLLIALSLGWVKAYPS